MYYQLLMLVSFVLAGYQDARERLVTDYFWIPGAVGAALVLFHYYPSADYVLLARIALIGGIGLAFSWLGFIGQADAIALALVASDPAPFAPIPVLVATGAVALSHISYLYVTGNASGPKVISMAEFRSQAKWIPRALIVNGERREVTGDVNVSREEASEAVGDGKDAANDDSTATTPTAANSTTMVEVQYGVPQVTYIAVGYVAYLVYLLAFQPSVFFAFP